MKHFKRILMLSLAIMMCSLISISAFAANDNGVTYLATIDNPTISVSSEDQTIAVTIKANKPVDIDSIDIGVGLPSGLAYVSVANTDLGFKTGDFNKSNGSLVWYYEYDQEADWLTTDLLAVVTYKVPANTPAGEYKIDFEINNITSDFGTPWETGVTVSTTLTIAPSTPAHTCSLTHVPEVKATCIAGGNIEYWYCSDEECGKYYSDANGVNEITDKTSVNTDIDNDNHVGDEASGGFTSNGDGTHYETITCKSCHNAKSTVPGTCSGGTATCTEKAVCSYCNTAYGPEPAGHGKTNGFRYNSNNNGTHDVVCDDCGQTTETNVKCSGTSTECEGTDTCSKCGGTFDLAHNITYVPEVIPENCQQTGHGEYWYCDKCEACFGDAEGSYQLNPAWLYYTGEHVRPEGAADCATVGCALCGEETYGLGEHDTGVPACQTGTCSKCNETITGYGCVNYTTPACMDGVCNYCGGFVAGFGHENGAWADCLDGECSYGCGLEYPATAEHKDDDDDGYCDTCWGHLNHDVDPCVGGMCSICETYVEPAHKYFYACDQYCMNCGEKTNPNATHSITHVEAKPGTDCQTYDGHMEYWTCSHCGGVWTDENLMHQTNMMSIKVNGNHTYTYNCDTNCKVCEQLTRPEAKHEGGTATCTKKAECSYCGKEYGELAKHEYFYPCDPYCCICYELTNPEATHSITHVEAKPGTDCQTYDGHMEYWTCSHCGGVWTDENLMHQTNMMSIKVNGNHTYTYNCDTNCNVCKELTRPEAKHEGGEATCKEKAVCQYCKTAYGELAKCTSLTAINGKDATCKESGWKEYWMCFTCNTLYADSDATKKIDVFADWKSEGGEGYIAVNPDNHVGGVSFVYENVTNTTHDKITVCSDCNKRTNTATEPHNYTTGNSAYTCICGKVKEFTLTIYALQVSGDADPENCPIEITVPYGALLKDYIPKNCGAVWNYAPIHEKGETVPVNGTRYNGVYAIDEWCDMDWNVVDMETATMPAGNFGIRNDYYYTGWWNVFWDGVNLEWSDTALGTAYQINSSEAKGWQQIDGDWYYFAYDAKQSHYFRVEGLTRVPYPVDEEGNPITIDGNKYAPNQEDIDYAANKGITFIDATEAWFIFDEDGKFQSDVNGKFEGPKATCYAVNGMIPWHYGLAKINNKYYYFVGDTVNGGNKVANGPVWITRANGVEGLDNGACYYFLGGVLAHNLTDIVDGKYYENGKLMMGEGLVKIEEGKYIYVRSSGQVATGMYWVTKTNGLVTAAMYNFGTDGILQSVEDPSVNGLVDGVYYKNGNPYYAGLIVIEGETYYVKSNGKVATGDYYITKVDNYTGDLNVKNGDKLTFNDEGKLQPMKDGIVDVDGVLYYYVNNHVKYGAGLIKYQGNIYYVRSNGQVATGKYYITNTNGMEGFVTGQKCYFDENGKLIQDGDSAPLAEGSKYFGSSDWEIVPENAVLIFTPEKSGKLIVEVTGISSEIAIPANGFSVDAYDGEGYVGETACEGTGIIEVELEAGKQWAIYVRPAIVGDGYFAFESGTIEYRITFIAD